MFQEPVDAAVSACKQTDAASILVALEPFVKTLIPAHA
jgi:hypothetical protein